MFGLLDRKQFAACLFGWTQAIHEATGGKLIAIDGLTLGQVACEEKSNEITAIPELLELLSLKGAVVTLDAMGMQKAIVEKIREKQADYVIGLKDNQPTLAADMQQLADQACETNFAGLTTDVFSTTEKARGGVEQWTVRVIEIPEDSPHRKIWTDLWTLAIVLTHVVRHGVERYEARLYLSSLPPNARRLSHAIRSHWGIENSLHWTMDVTFREDHHRLLDRNGVQNFSAVRLASTPDHPPYKE